MATKHIVKLSFLANCFENKQLQRGENAVESGHVFEASCDFNVEPALLKGKVHASMKNKVYNIEVNDNISLKYVSFSKITLFF